MSAARKISEAENILAKINDLSAKDFELQLDDFLTTVHEIFTQLLDEYNVKFNCKIERISLEKFKSKAKKSGNLQAVNFLIWYEKEYRKIRDDPEFGNLLERNHPLVSTDRAKVSHSCSNLLDSVKTMVYYAYENF